MLPEVLVVGGAGYIGGAVTDLLAQHKINFSVFDDLIYEPHFLKPVNFIRGNVLDTDLLKKTLKDFTHVIWLAAIVGDGACALTPDLTTSVNETAVKSLAENFHGRIIFASTCSVYGEHSDSPVSEDAPTKPLSLYAQTKLNAEGFLRDKNALIFRLGTVFGVSDTYSRPRMDLVANQMPVDALTKGFITLNGGQQWRPLIHVYDIARAIVKGLKSNNTGIYNLATNNIQMEYLAKEVASFVACEIRTQPLTGDTRDYRANVSKAIIDEFIHPMNTFSIGYGVNQFKKLIRQGRLKNPDSSVYFNVKHLKGVQ